MRRTEKADPPLHSLPVPADNEEFELTLNADTVDPIVYMIRDGRFEHVARVESYDWAELDLKRVTNPRTRSFKIVRLGGYPDLVTVRETIRRRWLGRKLAGCQWREAFRQRYHAPMGEVILLLVAQCGRRMARMTRSSSLTFIMMAPGGLQVYPGVSSISSRMTGAGSWRLNE